MRLASIKKVLTRSLGASRGNGQNAIPLRPQGSARGEVLLSFFHEPFLLRPGQPVSSTHQHHGESLLMARTFLDLGYAVDVISYTNEIFVPKKDYAIFVDARRNLERIAPLLNAGCVKVMHADTAHILFHNAAEASRLLALQQRRGITLRPRRWEMPTQAIEHADCATIYGNAFTLGTYAYAKKPLYPIPSTSPAEYLWTEGKDFDACRSSFLWLSSGGLVHKGLDLVLEAFATMPESHLTVCAPVHRERDFERAFHRELYELPNIHTVGWIDITGDEFPAIVRRCLAMIHPSCSEGQSGAVVTGMHAGLIPIVSYESGVDVQDFGVALKRCAVEEIMESVRRISGVPASSLEAMARRAWEFARSHHTHESFARAYRSALLQIVSDSGKDSQLQPA